MKTLFRQSLLVILTVALASCEPPHIKIALKTVNGRQVVSLSQDWGLIFSRKKAPCVGRIDLKASAGDRPLVWSVQSKNGECVYLSQFVIGEVPAGFVERAALRAVPHGWFDFVVRGTGTGEAQFHLGAP